MCYNHVYSKIWELGPIIYKKEEGKYYWWFYKRCSLCGEIELFPTWKLNPKQMRRDKEARDLFMVREQLA